MDEEGEEDQLKVDDMKVKMKMKVERKHASYLEILDGEQKMNCK